jgi:NTE family protein
LPASARARNGPAAAGDGVSADPRGDDTLAPSTTVSLVLGSGGARGYAHIGVIEELERQGLAIGAIAGSSMGALVGGIHAAGQLAVFSAWARALTRLDVWRLVDLTVSGGGFIKGERIIQVLRELVGEARIEQLPVKYTAVATDLDASREIWFTKGSLFDAIRASIAIPTIFRPVRYRGHTLVDGGLLNPVPVSVTLGDLTDFTIAADINAPDGPRGPEDARRVDIPPPAGAEPDRSAPAEPGSGRLVHYRQRIERFLDELWPDAANAPGPACPPAEPGVLDLFTRSLDTVQATLTRFKLAAQPPDLLIELPRSSCTFYEFDQAARLIELGRERARIALDAWRRGGRQA